MAFAEAGHRREERPDKPVSFLMVLHGLQREYEKPIELTASSLRSCFFCSSRDSRKEAALSESVPTRARCEENLAVSFGSCNTPRLLDVAQVCMLSSSGGVLL